MKRFRLKREEYKPKISIIMPDIDATMLGKVEIPKIIKNRLKIGIIIANIGTTMLGKVDIFKKNRLNVIFEIRGTFGIE